MKTWCFATAVLLGLAATPAVLAQDAPAEPEKKPPPAPPLVSFRGTETLSMELVGDNGSNNEYLYGDDDNFWIFTNSLYVQASSKPFDGGVRLDATLFHHPPDSVSPDEFIWGPGASGYTLLNYKHDFRVERIFGILKVGQLKLTAGDFYVTFGRGMVLSLVKADDISLDNALRGGRLDYGVPGLFKLVLVAGVVNSLNNDPITHQILEDDPGDKVAGGSLVVDVIDELSLGYHFVAMLPRFRDEASIDPERMFVDQSTGVRSLSGGLTLDLHVEDLSLYVEGNAQVHDNYRPPEGLPDVEGEMGYSAFMEATYDFSMVSLKAQGFYYRHWLVEGPLRGSATDITATQPMSYNFRVVLEPTWVPLKSVGNAWGGQLGGDLFVADGATQITLAGAVLKYEGGLLPQGQWLDTRDTVRVHPTLAVRQEFGRTGIRAKVEGGFLWEQEVAGRERDGFLWHALLDLLFPIKGPHSINMKAEIRRHELEISEGAHPYWVALGVLGYDFAGLLGAAVVYEYSDQTEGIYAKLGGWRIPLALQHYAKIKIVFHVPAPLDGLSLTFVGGSQRGGKKCTGGGCREFPDSVGLKLEALYRF
jgi:hypothetical protein